MLRASAPGKLIVLGEYAVLDGAPALVQAIDRQARIRLRGHGGAKNQVRALPIAPAPRPFTFTADGALAWSQPDSRECLAYVDALLSVLGPLPAASDRPWDIEIDTRDFFDAGAANKLGLGSSAALTVAMAAIWLALDQGPEGVGPQHWPERWLDTLVALHRGLQGGRGSGVDVAASLHGGLIGYRQLDQQTTRVDRLAPVPGVEWMWIWLGKSAATVDFLTGLAGFRRLDASRYDGHLQSLTELAEAGQRAVRRQDADGLLAIIDAYGQAMAQLGEAANLPIYTDDHRRLAQWAGRHGVAFKPSGAGGGDIALAASTDVQALAALARQVQAAGYRVLPLAAADTGLTIQWLENMEHHAEI